MRTSMCVCVDVMCIDGRLVWWRVCAPLVNREQVWGWVGRVVQRRLDRLHTHTSKRTPQQPLTHGAQSMRKTNCCIPPSHSRASLCRRHHVRECRVGGVGRLGGTHACHVVREYRMNTQQGSSARALCQCVRIKHANSGQKSVNRRWHWHTNGRIYNLHKCPRLVRACFSTVLEYR